MSSYFSENVRAKARVKEGLQWEDWLADLLRDEGFDNIITGSREIGETFTDRQQYFGEPDIVINDWLHIEVKARDLRFTTPETFPFNTIWIEDPTGWDRKEPKPLYIAVISKPTKIVLGLRVRGDWRNIGGCRDTTRGITHRNVVATKSELIPFVEMVEGIRASINSDYLF